MGAPETVDLPRRLDLVAENCIDNPLIVIAPTQHPLTREKTIPLARLRDEVFLIREQGSGTRIAMKRFFAQQAIRLTTGMAMNSNKAIKQAVQAGLGLGVVSSHRVALELEVKPLAVLDVESLPIIRHWYIVHREAKRLSPIAQTFKEFVLAEAEQLLANTYCEI